MAKISIEVGHGGKDVGAVGVGGVYEKDINLVVGLELKRQLERHGQDILISRETDCDDLAKDFYNKAKAWKPDLHISVHANAFNGAARGFEVFRSNNVGFKTKSTALCELIEKEVKALGQTSRGVKDSRFLMSSLSCSSAYCELGFIDNAEDYKQFDTVTEQKKFAVAYAKGVLKYLGYQWKDETVAASGGGVVAGLPSKGETVYRVVTGSFTDKKNAENKVKELMEKGEESFIVAEKV